ncbi:hypothetical protein [Alicyclobacillus shizuokensis]|uniref:hypothetical protein n=1 Tax=Alicyclobacillus shizuokensis TaxID=392014 RepID=UPI000A40CAC3|nr:hypothetical protein [Alicyclobacillus shizuokensis]
MTSALDGLDIREPVRWFARQMELKLRENDHKGGWLECDVWWLFSRLYEEVAELQEAMYEVAAGDASREKVIREAADIANFAMMIADLARK